MKNMLKPFIFFSLVITSCNGQRESVTAIKVNSQKTEYATVMDEDYKYWYGEKYAQRPDKYLQVSEYIRITFQDSKGNLWFGTNSEGVVRYDDKELKYFSIKEGLSGNQVTDITEDNYGNIWISTNAGISQYDGNQFYNYKITQSSCNNKVMSIYNDRNGQIWAGSFSGLSVFTGFQFVPVEISKEFKSAIMTITEDTKGNLWLGTDKVGAYKYDGSTFEQIIPEGRQEDKSVTSIVEDKSGNLWFGSMMSGISKYNGNTFTNFNIENKIENNEVWTIYEDKLGNIWFSSEGYGIYRYQNGILTNFSKKQKLPLHAVQTIFEDKQGRFWIGGGNGLYRMENNTFINITKNGPWKRDNC